MENVLEILGIISMIISCVLIFIPLIKYSSSLASDIEKMVNTYRYVVISCGVTTFLCLLCGDFLVAIIWALNCYYNYTTYKNHKKELEQKIREYNIQQELNRWVIKDE